MQVKKGLHCAHAVLQYELGKRKRGNIMTLVVNYNTKKELKEAVGTPLRYTETSVFGPEYQDTGTLTVAGRPHITGMKREFFAQVKMREGIIEAVK